MLPNNQTTQLPAWMNKQREGRTYTYKPIPRLPQNSLETYQRMRMPAWMREPQQRTKGQAGYYQTGDNERKTVMLNGQPVRMGPNSYIEPNRTPKQNGWQQMWNLLMGRGPADTNAPSGIAGVRG